MVKIKGRHAAPLLWALLGLGSGAAMAEPMAVEAPVPEPMTIVEAVAEALARNLLLQAGRHEVDAVAAEVITARLRPNPELEVETVGFDRGFARGEETEYAVALSYEIEGLGKRAARIRVAELGRSSAQLRFRDDVRALVFEVQDAAVELMLANANLDLARDNLASLERMVEISEARYRVGDLDGLELTRSRLGLRSFRNEVRQLEMARAQAQANLQVLLGREPGAPAPEIADAFRVVEQLPPFAELRVRALAERPDLRAAQAERELADADVRNQEVARRPDVTVGTEFRRFHEVGNYVGVFVSVPVPLFDRNQGEIARARAESLQAGASLRALEVEVEHQLREAYRNLTLAHELLQALDLEMLEDARRLRDVAEFSYRRGEASLIELLDANMVFNETVADYNEARAAMTQALFQIDFVIAAATE